MTREEKIDALRRIADKHPPITAEEDELLDLGLVYLKPGDPYATLTPEGRKLLEEG